MEDQELGRDGLGSQLVGGQETEWIDEVWFGLVWQIEFALTRQKARLPSHGL